MLDRFLTTDRRRAIRFAALVVGAGVLLFTWHLGTARLSGTEGHRAVTAHQMNVTGEYLVPTLYGYTYLKKPPLHYWILAGFERLTGLANEWVWRLPSALGAALLAGCIALLTARWLSPRAGLIAGFAQLGLVALWSQSRSADIDANNTLASALAALLLIDQLWMAPRAGWRLSLTLGVAFAAALLLKGPACLPVVVGAILGPALFNRRWRPLLRWRIWLALIAGLGASLAWAYAARRAVLAGGMPIDAGGLAEARERMMIQSWSQLGGALLLPLVVLAYGLPTSLGIAVPFWPPLRRAMGEDQKRLARALSGAALVALLVCVGAGTTNPRYAYIILPLLAPNIGLAGALWHQGALPRIDQVRLGAVTLAIAGALAVLGAVLLYGARDDLSAGAAILWAIALGIAAVVAIVPLARGRTNRGAWALAVLLVLAGMLFGAFNHQRRGDRSGYAAAMALRGYVGAGAPVTTWYAMWAQPEVLYYAGVNARPMPLGRPRDVPIGWILLYESEYPAWKAQRGEHLSRIARIPLNKSSAFLAWYD